MKFGANIKPIFDTDYPVVGVLPPTVEAAPTRRCCSRGCGAEGAAPAEGAAAAPAAEGGKERRPGRRGAKKEEKKK